MAKIRVWLLADKCLACGACSSLYPDLFELNAYHVGQMKTITQGQIIEDEVLIAKLKEAAAVCSSGAIVINEL